MDTYKHIICSAIKILRQKTGKNQLEFSEFCGISYDSLRKWETFRNVPSADNIDKICQANKIDIINLLLLSQTKLEKENIINEIITKLYLLSNLE